MKKIIFFLKKIKYFIFVLLFTFILFYIIQTSNLQKIFIWNKIVNSKIIDTKLGEDNNILSYTNFSNLVFHIWNETNYEYINNFFMTNMCFKLNDLIYYCETRENLLKNFWNLYDVNKDIQQINSYNILNKGNNKKFTYIKNEDKIVFILK